MELRENYPEDGLDQIQAGWRCLMGGCFWKKKKDSSEPPKPSSKPSRLEGQLDDLKLPEPCCKMMAAR